MKSNIFYLNMLAMLTIHLLAKTLTQ